MFIRSLSVLTALLMLGMSVPAGAGENLATLISGHCVGCDMHGQDLHGRDLHGQTYIGADMRNVNLRDADLRGARFIGVDLSGSHLDRSDLRDAIFTGSDFGDATLSGARVTGARCVGCEFRNANLDGANFKGATLCFESSSDHCADFSGASVSDADFREVRWCDRTGSCRPVSAGELRRYGRNPFTGALLP